MDSAVPYHESGNKNSVRNMVWKALANARDKTAYALCGPDPLKVIRSAKNHGFQAVTLFENNTPLAVQAQKLVQKEKDLLDVVQVLQGSVQSMAKYADLQKVGAFDFDFCGQPTNENLRLVFGVMKRHAKSDWPMINIGVSTNRVWKGHYTESDVRMYSAWLMERHNKLPLLPALAIGKIYRYMNELETDPKWGFELVRSFVYWNGMQWMAQVILRRSHMTFVNKKKFWLAPVTVLGA